MLSSELSEHNPPETLKCPRCDSLETKFCYYNNYSTTQPRHFCKKCKRYWTAGGSLRNVPVGGGLRKSKKSKLPNQVTELLSSSSPEELFGETFTTPNASRTLANPSSGGFAYSVLQTLPNPASLRLASPSSSADGAIDETLSNPSASFVAFPSPFNISYLDSAAESHYTGDGMTSSHFNYTSVRNFAHFYGGNGHTLSVEGLQQKDAASGGYKGFHGPGGSDQAQSNSGEISELACEPSQASPAALNEHQLGLSAGLYQRHHSRHRYQEQEQGVNGEESMGWHQNFCEADHPQGQGNLQSSAEDLLILQDSKASDRSTTEDEDEGLGNVINVRYPYDWEQVSEVLFGGTPDFFSMPGF